MEAQIRLKNLPREQVSELLPEDLILLGYRGSIAHNMYCMDIVTRYHGLRGDSELTMS
jgi:hypothetical protein